MIRVLTASIRIFNGFLFFASQSKLYSLVFLNAAPATLHRLHISPDSVSSVLPLLGSKTEQCTSFNKNDTSTESIALI